MNYQIIKIRNGLWQLILEDGSVSEHSTQSGAEKMLLQIQHRYELSPAKPDQPEGVSSHSHWYEGIDEKCACGSYLKDQPQPEEWEKIRDVIYSPKVDWDWSIQNDTLTYSKTYQLHGVIRDALRKEYERGREVMLHEMEAECSAREKIGYERGRKEEFESIQRQFNGKGIQHPDIRKVRADTLNEVEVMVEKMHLSEADYDYFHRLLQKLKDGNS